MHEHEYRVKWPYYADLIARKSSSDGDGCTMRMYSPGALIWLPDGPSERREYLDPTGRQRLAVGSRG